VGTLTRVRLVFVAERVNVRLRFGRSVQERRIDRFRREAWFTPQASLALVHWQANRYGTVVWWLAILRTVRPGDVAQTIPHVTPGAEILLKAEGRERVQAMLQVIDRVEQRGIAPIAVSPHYWRTVHNRLAARQPLPEYEPAQHEAYRRWHDLQS